MATSIHAERTWKIQAPDVRSDLDLSREEVASLLELAGNIKRTPQRFSQALGGRYLSLLFEKPSLRTRLTFELAIKQLGGDSVHLNGEANGREPLRDVARNLDRWTSAIVARTFSQDTIDDLARWSSVPVINALTDLYHPCQALADMFTLEERFGELRGLRLAFIGDGNNVAHSLMLNAARLGIDFALATPRGYEANPKIASQAEAFARASGASFRMTNNAREAVDGAQAVYTDVWTSMGQEHSADQRRSDFAGFQVDRALMALAQPGAVFMHCLPAKRGEEVSDDVIESAQSIVFDQAENRLHLQKALLVMLLA